MANALGDPDVDIQARHDSRLVFVWEVKSEGGLERKEVEVRASHAVTHGIAVPRCWRRARTVQSADAIAAKAVDLFRSQEGHIQEYGVDVSCKPRP